MPDFIRKTIRLKEFDYKTGYVYFVTICTKDKKHLFNDSKLAEFVASTIDHRVRNSEVIVYCYCIMSNHIHLLLSICEEYEKDLSAWIGTFKKYISIEGKKKFGIDDIWQKNYYDHVVRNDESMKTIADYILNNPVRKGIVDEWEKYPFSRIMV